MSRRQMLVELTGEDLVVTSAFFRETGLLWKINHDILHPLGLALGVKVHVAEDGTVTDPPEPAVLSLYVAEDGVWTYTEDIDAEKAGTWYGFVESLGAAE